ncbi:HVO_0758 family zinc finger protein [Haladaptatus sp. T7]|uniref:HVO_0758 family zinc finger protein n=1 Tax=Haladaptatus sp. T7 TaxID=2029368 RepID=UPI00279569B9|nr:HVO_0758 family zinc finger protein [Haladaptatus sp. T7]
MYNGNCYQKETQSFPSTRRRSISSVRICHSVVYVVSMQSVRSGLRKGEVEKDTYGRLSCSDCGESLKTRNDPDEVYSVRLCPNCDSKWKVL